MTAVRRRVSSQTFQQMIRKPLYAGRMRVKDWKDYPAQRGSFEAIVTDDLFDAVQLVLRAVNVRMEKSAAGNCKGRRVRRRLSVLWVVLLWSRAAVAISLTGQLDPNNAQDAFRFEFDLSAAGQVRIQSWGYGGTANAPGGTNAAGMVIPPGGFDPYVSGWRGGSRCVIHVLRASTTRRHSSARSGWTS